ncbi:hypothetical protein [uncultured Tateyamaria sp.]|uniref:hypothetical protein n=1 Tax=uncultured Tateyamaria sp. TaxID=455651 RepID=UPI0026387F1A|nr:hypothetical protein [uncultured Tateyamaria sp.]
MPKVRAKSAGEYPVNQWRKPGDVFDYPLGKGEKLPSWVEAQGGSSAKAAPKSKSQPEDEADD